MGIRGLGSASDADRLRQPHTGANMIAMPDVGHLAKSEDPERFKEMLSALHAAISFISKACAVYAR